MMYYKMPTDEFWFYILAVSIASAYIAFWFCTKNSSEEQEELLLQLPFLILKKGDSIKAVNLENSLLADELIQELLSIGFAEVERLQATNKDAALEAYNESIKLSPLDEANLTIRKANSRVAELKKTIDTLEMEVLGGKAVIKRRDERILDLEKQLESRGRTESSYTDYQWLGFSSSPSRQELKKKYQRLTQVYHPDKGGCNVMMSKINGAYERLLAKI
ncbi:J domain-containing protein [Vibrio sp. SCSIO 43135]|uniref:J domain-containing protein n=1 Tax=Vibrio sp. SCSIO 43135 TaxID=2819096 RepID=UPI0020754ADE|nr:J domain-containing protein [Vibrio sp. SCSIO 43135]USD42142.1 J domain-containing protein [Vibrio sp. SCSIO 43135]